MDDDLAIIWLGCIALVLAVMVIRLARAYEALYMEWQLADMENMALFRELQDGRSTTA